MNSAQQIQERRRDELLRRQLGPQLLAAIADPKITDIIINEDGRVWFEAHRKGLFAAGFSLPESHRESLIGTVAATLGTVADVDHPIVEGELSIERIRFEGLMPPVVRRPCFAMRKPAQVLYTLDDYVRDRIITESQTSHCGGRRSRPTCPCHDATSSRPDHHRRGARRRSARTTEGVAHRTSGRVTTIHANSARAALSAFRAWCRRRAYRRSLSSSRRPST
jgi:type IV secretory pathway ATPase VirB11/archaellum biosynthesis ATPase